MSQVQVEQKSYQMPPQDGITIAHFSPSPTSSDRFDFTKRSSAARILSRGDSKARRVHPDREHVAPSQPRGRADARQTDGNAQRPADPNYSTAL